MRAIIYSLLALLLTGCSFVAGPWHVYGGVSYAPSPDTAHDAYPTQYATPEIAPSATPTFDPRVCHVRLTDGDWLRIRSGPGVEHDRVGWVRNGAQITVIGAEWDEGGNLWYQITPGWVAGWLVRC